MKKRRMVKILRQAWAKGCTCVIMFGPPCGACLASDLLGLEPPPRQSEWAARVAKAIVTGRELMP